MNVVDEDGSNGDSDREVGRSDRRDKMDSIGVNLRQRMSVPGTTPESWTFLRIYVFSRV